MQVAWKLVSEATPTRGDLKGLERLVVGVFGYYVPYRRDQYLIHSKVNNGEFDMTIVKPKGRTCLIEFVPGVRRWAWICGTSAVKSYVKLLQGWDRAKSFVTFGFTPIRYGSFNC